MPFSAASTEASVCLLGVYFAQGPLLGACPLQTYTNITQAFFLQLANVKVLLTCWNLFVRIKSNKKCITCNTIICHNFLQAATSMATFPHPKLVICACRASRRATAARRFRYCAVPAGMLHHPGRSCLQQPLHRSGTFLAPPYYHESYVLYRNGMECTILLCNVMYVYMDLSLSLYYQTTAGSEKIN